MVSRRGFCFLSSVGAITALTGPLSASISAATALGDDIILGGGNYREKKGGKDNFVISKVNLNTKKLSLETVTFLPHGFHRDPTDTNRIAVFEKKGPGALEFNMRTGETERTISVVKGRHFYGHGAYSADGKLLFSTESILSTRMGVIGIRDAKTLAYLGEFPSYGSEPHECKLIDRGNTLVVTNGGGPIGGAVPSVCYIDMKTQKLIERVELSNANVNTGHLAVDKKGGLIVVSAPRAGLGKKHLGGVSIRLRGRKMKTPDSPKKITSKMLGEALSVVVHEPTGIAIVTHPNGNMLTFWSIVDGRFIKSIELLSPRGVELTLDQHYFIVTYGAQANIAMISTRDLQLHDSKKLDATYLTGSHIYNWSRSMNEMDYPGPLA